jgi:hypothetical protein
VNSPGAVHMQWAAQLLAHEGIRDAANGASSAAAGRVYDKIFLHLATIIGDAGVQSVFVRSAKVVQGEFVAFSETPLFERPLKLRDYLHKTNPAVTTEAATVLFATFFALISTFIGKRLLAQVLRRTWPTLEISASMETIE